MKKAFWHGNASGKQIAAAIVLNFLFACIEIIVGVFSNSLVLVADALHDASDVFALGIALIAAKKASSPPTSQKTFGFARTTVIAAMVNSAVLIMGTVFVFSKALERLSNPQPVQAMPVFIVAVFGLLVHSFVALGFFRKKKDLNFKALFLHAAEDALGWISVLISAVVILFTGFTLIDPLMTFIVGIFVLASAVRVLSESVDVLMESVPKDLDLGRVKETLLQIQGVVRVHDLHVWSISSGFFVLSCHLGVKNIQLADGQKIAIEAKKLLKEKFRINHSTIELECIDCEVIDGKLVCKN